MKISTVATLTNLSISTIRYYINQGLLLPEKINKQYSFSEEDVSNLRFISMWKQMGFSIEEILHLVTLKRSSNWIEIENFIYYFDILKNKKKELQQDCENIKAQLELIDQELLSMEQNELTRFKNSKPVPQGVPLQCLQIITCPYCGKTLTLSNANMDFRYIYQSDLECTCGYHAFIKDGILYAPQMDEKNTSKPIFSSKDNPELLPRESNLLIQRADTWVYQRLIQNIKPASVIMEAGLYPFFFLYTNLKKMDANNILILVDSSAETVSNHKRYIEMMHLDIPIVYLVTKSHHLPIKKKSIDILIDFFHSNYNSLYSKRNFLKDMQSFLSTEGRILMSYFSLHKATGSMKKLHASFPGCQPNCYMLNEFKEQIKEVYIIDEAINLGYATDASGSTCLNFMESNEKIYVECMNLLPQK